MEQDTAITVFAPKKNLTARTEVFIGTGSVGWRPVGSVTLDATGGPWILPRTPEDAALRPKPADGTIADYGYEAVVGDVVLHRDRRCRFATITDARQCKAVQPVPMLRAPEIRSDGTLQFRRSKRIDCYVDVGINGRGLVRGAAVALQRVSSPDQPRRLICAEVPTKLQTRYGGVIGENHVNFLRAKNGSAVAPELVARILGSETVDRLFRCRSGANNVSVYELTNLPLPDPEIVRLALAAGADINAAVRTGYGISAEPSDDNKDGNLQPTYRAAQEP